MKEKNGTDVNIVPQLDKACGLDMHKDKIVGLFLAKMAADRNSKSLAHSLAN